jgi:hypothetical protein
LLENVALLENDTAKRIEFPWYESPYIGTSPNHYAQWAELLYLSGLVLKKHLTLSAVAVYWEHSKDPDVLPALRRSLAFHENFTYPDDTPVETINDRNRYRRVSPWAQFAFSNFPEGRRYAEFLTDFFNPDKLTMEELGRLSQDTLYYHEGI